MDQPASIERHMPVDRDPAVADPDSAKLYLDLMKKCLTRSLFPEQFASLVHARSIPARIGWQMCRSILSHFRLELVRRASLTPSVRAEGLDWPAEAETMVGLKRMDNLEYCIERVIREGVPGDLIETGVWRGGASIFMRAVLKAYGDRERIVWLADSFKGFPKPNPDRYPADASYRDWNAAVLVASLEEVQENFRRYNLLDDQVRFLVGWFRDTLPSAPINALAILRLDGDMYESTIDSLTYLYPKLTVGGFAIIDDYGLPTCRAAVEDYRGRWGIKEELWTIDRYASFWRRVR